MYNMSISFVISCGFKYVIARKDNGSIEGAGMSAATLRYSKSFNEKTQEILTVLQYKKKYPTAP